MKTTTRYRSRPLWILAFSALATTAFADDSGPASFKTEGRSYLGRYSTADSSLTVEIEGMKYRGNFTQTTVPSDLGSSEPAGTGSWGKAFLFASSAKILQCQLDSGFPELRGKCRSADGRDFRLEASNSH